jgi:hypothetical protein
MSQESIVVGMERGKADNSRVMQSGLREADTLTMLDRILLVVPIIAGFFFGLGPLFLTVPFANLLGYVGNDQFIYWLAGAATLGYGVALAVGIKEGSWRAMRFMVIAILVFNLASLYACAFEVIGGTVTGMIYFITVASILLVGMSSWMLYEHRTGPYGPRDVPNSGFMMALRIVATIASITFGVLGTFLPVGASQFFGYKGTEVSLYREAGASTLGYAVMALFILKSQNWKEIRLPTLMAIVFNGVSFVAAIRAILQGDPLLLPVVVAVATFAVTLMFTYSFVTTRTNE